MKKYFIRNLFRNFGIMLIIAGSIFYTLSKNSPNVSLGFNMLIESGIFYIVGVLCFIVMKLCEIQITISNINNNEIKK